jgi:hypothetical protein
MFSDLEFRKPTKEIVINQLVYSKLFECIVKVKNIRVDSLGSPIFDLEDLDSKVIVARFCEIMEIY